MTASTATSAGLKRADAIGVLHSLVKRENSLTRCCAIRAMARLCARDDRSQDLLIESLRDDDADVRMEGVAALGRRPFDEAIAPLIESLANDPDGDVRIQVVGALSCFRDDRVVSALIECLDTERETGHLDVGDDMEFLAVWEIQRIALEALGEMRAGRAAAPVIELLENDELDDLQETGFRVLARLEGVEAGEFLLQRLTAGNQRARRQAARALDEYLAATRCQGQSREAQDFQARASSALHEALRDEDSMVRLQAMRALVRSASSVEKQPGFLDAVIDLLVDPDDRVSIEAARIAGALSAEEITERVLGLLECDHRETRRRAIRVLGDSADREVVPVLLHLLGSDDDDMVLDVVRALDALGFAEAVVPLCGIVDDTDAELHIRIQAIQALGRILKKGVFASTDELDPTQILITASAEADPRISLAAACSLVAIEPTLAVPTLSRILNRCPAPGDREDNRLQAARLLGDVRRPESLRALIGAVDEDHPGLYREIVLALGCIGHEDALPSVRAALTSVSSEVRVAAVDALARFTWTPDTRDRMVCLLDDPDPLVRQRVIRTLRQQCDFDALRVVTGALEDPIAEVRREALCYLADADAGDVEVVHGIENLIFDRAGLLKTEAAQALRRLGSLDTAARLVEILNDEHREEQHWICVDALAELFADPREN